MVNTEKTIDETVLPFLGQLLLKQYMPIKHGIKVLKLCTLRGYA
jgi:hypothetical protein